MPHPIALSTLDAERERHLAHRILRDAYWLAIAGSLVAAIAAWQHLALRQPLPALPIGPGIDGLVAAFALALLLAAWRCLGLHRRTVSDAVPLLVST